jgi:hypothetical protein
LDELIKTGKTSRRDTAMEDWAAEVRAIAEPCRMLRRCSLRRVPTMYTLTELHDELQVYYGRGQQLSDFMTAGRLAGYNNYLPFKEIKAAILEECCHF